jgi:hypothetical protein
MMREHLGAPTFFSDAEEEILANLCKALCRCKRSVTVHELNVLFQNHISFRRRKFALERGHIFDDEKDSCRPLSRKWYARFMKRNNLALRVAESLSTGYQKASKADVELWFENHRKHFEVLGIWGDVLQTPERIFNVDETNLPVHPVPKKVIAPRGERNVNRCLKGQAKQAASVVVCGNAAGQLAPSMFIFPGKNRLRGLHAAEIPDGAHIEVSNKGWQTKETFLSYLKIFNEWLEGKGIEKPVILFADLHTSRLDLEVMEFTGSVGIYLTCFPPNLTNVMQPLDVSVMKPIKTAYDVLYQKWNLRNNNAITASDYLKLSMDAIKCGGSSTNLQSGFKACGIHPWDPKRTNIDKIPSHSGEDSMLCAAIMEGVEMCGQTRPGQKGRTIVSRSVQVSQQIVDEANLHTTQMEQPGMDDVAVIVEQQEKCPDELFITEQLQQAIANILPCIKAEQVACDLSKFITGPIRKYFSEKLKCPRHVRNERSVDADFIKTIEEACDKLQSSKEIAKKCRRTAHGEIYSQTKSLNLSSPGAINVMRDLKMKRNGVKARRENLQSSMQLLTLRAEEMGKEVKNNDGGGNCLFLAVAEQIEGECHLSLRKKAAQQMRRSPDCFHGFYSGSESFEEYIEKIAEDGTWADHPTLEALSRAIGKSIHVVAPYVDHDVIIQPHLPSRIYVGHIPEQHYVALISQLCAASHISDDCSVTTNVSSISVKVPPMPDKIDWFVILDEDTPRVAYQAYKDGKFEETYQNVTALAERCQYGKKVYTRIEERQVMVNILTMAKQVENAGGMETRSGGIRFASSQPFDKALGVLLQEHTQTAPTYH